MILESRVTYHEKKEIAREKRTHTTQSLERENRQQCLSKNSLRCNFSLIIMELKFRLEMELEFLKPIGFHDNVHGNEKGKLGDVAVAVLVRRQIYDKQS